MKTSEAGKNIIKGYESLSLHAYICPAGVLTIGWGHTGKDVYQGMVISESTAEALLSKDLIRFENSVSALVTVPLSQNQFDALISFTFNLGAKSLESSTLLKLLNSKDYKGAAEQFPRWNKGKVNGKLTVINGLVKRRETERQLFLS